MTFLQLSSIGFAFLSPPALWAIHRRRADPRIERFFARCYAGLLIAILFAGPIILLSQGALDPAHTLPMHLCDWALIAVAAALLLRSQTCFELGYFWSLCGTIQALFTPAIRSDVEWWRLLLFFLGHAAIVAGVLFLLLVTRMRPRSIHRTLFWSEIYLISALAVNAWTGDNYGFLSHKPVTPSMLDLFSNVHWVYVAEINIAAVALFAALYAPWVIMDKLRA